jgi:hypothetical protein
VIAVVAPEKGKGAFYRAEGIFFETDKVNRMVSIASTASLTIFQPSKTGREAVG